MPPEPRNSSELQDHAALMSQIATSITGRGGGRYLPYVITEHGAILAATILNSPQAAETRVFIVRGFVEVREALATHKELAERFHELDSRIERKLATHDQATRRASRGHSRADASPADHVAQSQSRLPPLIYECGGVHERCTGFNSAR